MRMKKLIYILTFSSITSLAIAQDFHLSQYDAAALNFNPAMTGMFSGQMRIHGHYRTQWSQVATKPYVTGLLAYDQQLRKNFSWGAQVANFRAGSGNYNVFSALLSGAYDIKLDDKNYHHISIGVQGGVFNKSIDYNRLSYETQYTPFGGGTFDNAISSGEPFASNSIIAPDFNAGLMYYYGKETSLMNPFVGGSLFHINQPKETFFNQGNKLPMRYIIHGGVKVNISERIQVLPKVLYMFEKEAEELTYSCEFHYYLKDNDAYLMFIPYFRSKDAAVMNVGLKLGRFTYRLSYDINTSTLKPASNGRGGLELSVTFINKKIDPNPIRTCPRL